MWRDLLLALLGPAGIWFGWILNQRTAVRLAERADTQAALTAERERVLHAVRLARQVSSGSRDVLHGIYLKATGKAPSSSQMEAMLAEYNVRRDALRDAVLTLRVQGPSWAVGPAEDIDLHVSRLNELAFVMQRGVQTAHMETINAEVPRLDALVNNFTAEVGQRYNDDARSLPPPPDYETDGRWRAN